MLFGSCTWRGLHHIHRINSQAFVEASIAGLAFCYLLNKNSSKNLSVVYVYKCHFCILLSVKSHCTTYFQHKEFEEIHARWRRREPLIVATTATQQLSRRLPVEVIRDPVIENEIDPFEEGNDRNHQVLFSVSYIITYRFLMC